MKIFKIREDYQLIYLGQESFNECIWYHCILINKDTNEIEVIIDYKLDSEQRFYNLRTQPVKDFISWNIAHHFKYINEIINECDITISKMIEKQRKTKIEWGE